MRVRRSPRSPTRFLLAFARRSLRAAPGEAGAWCSSLPRTWPEEPPLLRLPGPRSSHLLPMRAAEPVIPGGQRGNARERATCLFPRPAEDSGTRAALARLTFLFLLFFCPNLRPSPEQKAFHARKLVFLEYRLGLRSGRAQFCRDKRCAVRPGTGRSGAPGSGHRSAGAARRRLSTPGARRRCSSSAVAPWKSAPEARGAVEGGGF